MKRTISGLIGIVLILAMTLALVGCHKKTVEETTTPTQAVSTIVSPYEADMKLYKSVIDALPEGAFYAFADMNENHDALLVAENTYADPEDGTLLAIAAKVYGLDKDGNIKEYGTVESGGTANPLMTKDHHLYYGGHHYMSKASIDESASKLVVETGKDEMGGGTKDEAKLFDQLYSEYAAGTMVGFTKTTAGTAAAAGAAAAAKQKADNKKDNVTKKNATTKKAAQKTNKKATQKATQKATKKATQKTTEATGSPVQRFQGKYASGRCTVEVIGVANNSVEIHVYWSSSAWEHSEWTMSGNFDEDANGFYVYYSDGVRKDIKYNEDGTKESTETVYEGGKGAFRFNGNKMTWSDQTSDHVADNMVFTRV